MSMVFNPVLKIMAVKHQVSRAAQLESQGALERFHLKSMPSTFCLERGPKYGMMAYLFCGFPFVKPCRSHWDSVLLVFCHTVRGSLKLLHEQLMADFPPNDNVLGYVRSFRDRLHYACDVFKQAAVC